ncbi:UDP-N-acetyl-D-mannosamine dehydrogenase [Candidatus Gugararchaeum adminiculabundum]|nr:UDP-N-acetyl-D-mannosamine dehydrogenase [Candidatus Gugararchaeum adminiculabundum]
MKKIGVIGMGYVGIPVALAFADAGIKTVGIDISADRVSQLNKGVYPLEGEEPGIADLLKKVQKKGNFSASSDYSELKDADCILICVQTPLKENKEPDHTYLKSALESVSRILQKGTLVSIESTIAPLTTQTVALPILERGSGMKAGTDFYLVHCPERVTPGKLLHNLRKMSRIVGGINDASTKKALEFYAKIVEAELHPSDALSAEITKTAENSYRDMEIAFANELALICEQLGVDAFKIRDLVNTCPFRYVHLPGIGVGGHCIPKDSWLLMYGVKGKTPTPLLKTVREINDSMPAHTASLVAAVLAKKGKEVKNSKIAILGFSYLPDSDDTRSTPARVLYKFLKQAGASLAVFDPFVHQDSEVKLSKTLEEAVSGSDCIILATAHTSFKSLNSASELKRIRQLLRTPCLVDGRNLFDKKLAQEAGYAFTGVGKG